MIFLWFFWVPIPGWSPRRPRTGSEAQKAYKNGAAEADFRGLLEQQMIESRWFIIIVSYSLEIFRICFGDCMKHDL